jgi:H+/Cl- antiporter ClcA
MSAASEYDFGYGHYVLRGSRCLPFLTGAALSETHVSSIASLVVSLFLFPSFEPELFCNGQSSSSIEKTFLFYCVLALVAALFFISST